MNSTERDLPEDNLREIAERVLWRVEIGKIDLRQVAEAMGEKWDQDFPRALLAAATRKTEAADALASIRAERDAAVANKARVDELLTAAVDDYNDAIQRSANASRSSAIVEPMAGWKLVPVEPTPEMMAANSDASGPRDQATIDDWHAMLAAAPPSPQPHTGRAWVSEALHETAVGELRILKRTLEMQSSIMRDPIRTGGWAGAERVANAFASAADRLATIILTQEPALNAALTVEPEAGEVVAWRYLERDQWKYTHGPIQPHPGNDYPVEPLIGGGQRRQMTPDEVARIRSAIAP
jgi:hypothetical protein